MIEPKTISRIVSEHDNYWDDLRPLMRRLKNAYETKYWDRSNSIEGQIIIEAPRGYEYIEGYIASLFARNPAVVVKGDLRGRGNAKKAESLVNQFLLSVRSVIEDASRLALVYPCAFLKMAPKANPDLFRRVEISAISPWDVIIDDKASSWDNQRFVAHRYWVTLHKAKERWGNKRYNPQPIDRYIDTGPILGGNDADNDAALSEDPFDHFIQVVEVWDLQSDRMLVWSPNYKDGKSWLYDGIEIETEKGPTKIETIPFRTPDDHPVIPIVPIYYSRLPDDPLRGYSALARVYDQIQEINISRTFQANAVRKAARQWIVEKGVFDSESMAKLAQGIDGEFVEVELSPGQDITGSIIPMPHTPTPPEIQRYIEQVQDDLDRGSVLAPFTRGNPAGGRATATEITALASYSTSEIGRLARERDSAIETMAQAYIRMTSLYLDGGNDLVVLDGKAEVLASRDLDGDFAYFAQDSGSTPVSEAQRKIELLQAVNLLSQLGVPVDALRKEVVRLLQLPESFLPEQPAEAVAPGGSAQMPPSLPPAAEAVRDDQLGLAPGALPSPNQISRVLPS